MNFHTEGVKKRGTIERLKIRFEGKEYINVE